MNSNLGRSKAVLMGLMLAGSLLVVFSPTAAARCHPITHDCFEYLAESCTGSGEDSCDEAAVHVALESPDIVLYAATHPDETAGAAEEFVCQGPCV